MDDPINQLTNSQFINFEDFEEIYKLLNYESHAIVHEDWDHPSLLYGRKENWCIMSALISPDDAQKYLRSKQYNNYPFGGLGDPQIWAEAEADDVQFDLGQQREAGAIKAHYFIRRYQPYNIDTPRFPVAQSFIFYHKLSEDVRKNKRLFVDALEDAEVIVEKLHPDNSSKHIVRINRRYLREYLTARKMALVVWASVQREVTTDKELNLKPGPKNATTHLNVLNPIGSSYSTELICKTVIKPYSNIKWSRQLIGHGQQHELHIPLIIGIDDKSGEEIFSEGIEDFRPVYFKKDVLARYVGDNRFVVDSLSEELGEISYLNQGHLVYGINSMGRLVVLHQHLGRLSGQEQIYWKYFNVPPEGGLPEEFRRVYIDGRPPQSVPLEKTLIKLRDEINDITMRKHNCCLFIKNEDEDVANIQQLQITIGKGATALRPQIVSLYKLFIDSIDADTIRQKIKGLAKARRSDGKNLGALHLLQEHCEQKAGVSPRGVKALKLVKDLRNNYEHKFSKTEYARLIESYDNRLDPLDIDNVYTFILQQLVQQLMYLKGVLR